MEALGSALSSGLRDAFEQALARVDLDLGRPKVAPAAALQNMLDLPGAVRLEDHLASTPKAPDHAAPEGAPYLRREVRMRLDNVERIVRSPFGARYRRRAHLPTVEELIDELRVAGLIADVSDEPWPSDETGAAAEASEDIQACEATEASQAEAPAEAESVQSEPAEAESVQSEPAEAESVRRTLDQAALADVGRDLGRAYVDLFLRAVRRARAEVGVVREDFAPGIRALGPKASRLEHFDYSLNLAMAVKYNKLHENLSEALLLLFEKHLGAELSVLPEVVPRAAIESWFEEDGWLEEFLRELLNLSLAVYRYERDWVWGFVEAACELECP